MQAPQAALDRSRLEESCGGIALLHVEERASLRHPSASGFLSLLLEVLGGVGVKHPSAAGS